MFGMPLVGHHLHNYTARDVEVTKTSMSLLSDYVKYGYVHYHSVLMYGCYLCLVFLIMYTKIKMTLVCW